MLDHTHSLGVSRSQPALRLLPWLNAASILLICGLTGYITLTNLHTSYDDAYITYRYAANFAQGYGFVYNRHEHFMGTTAPLWGLILGVLGGSNPSAIPLLGNLLSGLSLLGIGLALYSYARLHGQPVCGLLAAVFFVVNPLIPPTFGGEMLFQAALILWAFVTYRLDRTRLPALLLGLAILTRPDSIVALGVFGMHYLVTRRRLPWQELLVLAATLLPPMVLAWTLYGSPLPGTLEAKQAQRDSGLWPLFTHGTIEWLRGFTMQDSSTLYRGLPAGPAMIRYLLFVVLGVPALLWVFRFWLLPLSWIALYALGYHLLNVPFYHWYVVPIVLGLLMLAASGVAGCIELALRIVRHVQPRLGGQALAVLCAGCFVVLAPGVYAQMEYNRRLGAHEPSGGKVLYIKAGQWLKQHTLPDASVGYFEIGFLGYYAERTMVDPVGLVNPGVAPHVAEGDLTWAYRHYQPDYIVHNPLIFQQQIGRMLDEPWFADQYHHVGTVEYLGSVLEIYQRAGSGE